MRRGGGKNLGLIGKIYINLCFPSPKGRMLRLSDSHGGGYAEYS